MLRKVGVVEKQLRKYIFRRTFHSTTRNGQIPLTSEIYPNLKRGSFAKLTSQHISLFEGILGKERVNTPQNENLDAYNIDWVKNLRGNTTAVLRPRTSEEVSEILKICNKEQIAVCPQGGNTGLVGGGIPIFDEIIISTQLMNKIINIDDLSGVLVCQAGCILEVLDQKLADYDLMMPLDLGAKGSCHIGGNVSTNAGGLRLLRYGSLHGNVLGIEAVKADGEIVDCLSTLKKDNTGYHLKHLFIGSEGTLGIVTKVAIKCPPLPKSINLAFLGLESFESVLETYRLSRQMLGEVLSSCEMMDKDSVDASANIGHKCPIGSHPFYMIVETSGSNQAHDAEKLETFLQTAMERNLVTDGTQTDEPGRIKSIWSLRESIPNGLMREGYLAIYDITIPLAQFYQLVKVTQHHLKDRSDWIRCCGFGHLGDGNLHLNITSPTYDEELLHFIEPFIYQWTQKQKGSISAEHGIGFKKTQFIGYSKSESALRMMRDIKKVMDPKGILNPYKVLPIDN